VNCKSKCNRYDFNSPKDFIENIYLPVSCILAYKRIVVKTAALLSCKKVFL